MELDKMASKKFHMFYIYPMISIICLINIFFIMMNFSGSIISYVGILLFCVGLIISSLLVFKNINVFVKALRKTRFYKYIDCLNKACKKIIEIFLPLCVSFVAIAALLYCQETNFPYITIVTFICVPTAGVGLAMFVCNSIVAYSI